MGFYWVGFIFWTLIGCALLLFVYGLCKKSSKALLISGTAFILPMLYFGGAENWYGLLAFVPLIPFVLAYYTNKRVQR
ncbi:hypothetical protein SAMN05443529_1121 [Desulfosporosinus hippei DSM 8344]|uniref:Uncharacterized protein n=1 Tax=Desulfosporosinus hippei DSM 8344 TaxID=1121419 RepID=A0A1G8BC89_9FIRM|nr:hypothetical protein SAMN05443529_1121 [Desulfosporosinus hippei DSM 8344]